MKHQTIETKWQLIDESGIDYLTSDANQDERLCFPTFAEQAEDGTYVIGEELGIEKQVPFRFECRTIRVDADRNIVFDTLEQGMEDGYGCLIDDGCMAILRRTKWELLVVSPRGEVIDRLGLAAFSKRMPRYVSCTDQGTFLLVFFNRSRDIDIVEIDRQGHLLWHLPPQVSPIGIPASVQLMPANTLLIADSFHHVVREVDRGAGTVWQYGEEGFPSRLGSCLSSPNCIRALPDGRRLIADTRNHRILSVRPDGAACQIKTQQSVNLCDPTSLTALRNEHYLICDTGNARVIELDRQGHIAWQYGGAVAARRTLSYPRSVEVSSSAGYLVADTANDRVVDIVEGQTNEQPFHGEPALFWPRCVRALPSGSLLIADSRNGRIIEVSTEGDVLRQLTHFRLDGERSLQDPHDVRMLANGHLLVTDSPQDIVLEVDWEGSVYQVIGSQGSVDLDDPHSAQRLEDGCIVISDTGHHRILVIDPDGKCMREIGVVRAESFNFRLHHPRYAEVIDDRTLVIADTGHNRILAATTSGRFIWEFSCVPNSRLPFLNQPRWAKLISRYECLVCDHFHHRILHVAMRRREA